MRHLIRALNTQDHHTEFFTLIVTITYSIFAHLQVPRMNELLELSWYASKQILKTVIHFQKLQGQNDLVCILSCFPVNC